VWKLSELLQFQSKEERLHRMDEFIDAMLEDNLFGKKYMKELPIFDEFGKFSIDSG
jgi:hypothetical protein